MRVHFFDRAILNAPYDYPSRHWELDADGQPTNSILETRRHSDLITPVPKPKKTQRQRDQAEMVFDTGEGLSTADQEYNPNLGLEVTYLRGGVRKKYVPDFIVQIDDGHQDPLNLIVEAKGYRGENAKEKANTLRTYWVPGVNNLGRFGRWSAAEVTDVYEIDSAFNKLLDL